jgi:hypothetical protein
LSASSVTVNIGRSANGSSRPSICRSTQHYFRYITFHVRTQIGPRQTALLTSELRRSVPDVFVDFSPMTDVLSVAVFPARVGAAVTGAFGALCDAPGCAGSVWTCGFSVAQRTAEIWCTKGPRRPDRSTLCTAHRVRENVLLRAPGSESAWAYGTLGANLLRSFITDVSPIDPLTVARDGRCLEMGVALLASASPILRAVRVSPRSCCETREPVDVGSTHDQSHDEAVHKQRPRAG